MLGITWKFSRDGLRNVGQEPGKHQLAETPRPVVGCNEAYGAAMYEPDCFRLLQFQYQFALNNV